MEHKNSLRLLIIGLLIFFAAFLFSRIQFFVCPVVEITTDSGLYIASIDDFHAKGQLPPTNIVQIGYPVVVKALLTIHDSVYTVVYFQFLLTFLSFSLLLYQVWRFYNKSTYLIALFCLIAYVQIPNNLYYDIAILTESVYNSCLVLLVVAMVGFFNNPNKNSTLLLSAAVATPAIFRHTGIFAVIIFLLLIVYLFYMNRKEFLLYAIAPFLFIYLSLSLYSFIASGDPVFIGGKTAEGVMLNKSTGLAKQTAHQDSLDIPLLKQNKIEKTFYLYSHYSKQSQMYCRIDEANDKYFRRNFAHTNEWGCCYYEWYDSSKTEKRKSIFKEFYDTDKMGYLVAREKTVKQSKLFKIFDLFSIYVVKKLLQNTLWVVLMFVSLAISFVISLKAGFKNNKALLLFFIILVNIGTAGIVIAGHNLAIPRYGYPAEFIFLLQLPFIIDLLAERKNAFR